MEQSLHRCGSFIWIGIRLQKALSPCAIPPMKCFNNFVESAVIDRRKGDENSKSSVVAETMKLVANSSYGYQKMDRSLHTVTKYLSDETNPWSHQKQNVWMSGLLKWSTVRSRVCQVRNWTQWTDNCWVLHPAVCKIEKATAVSYLLGKILRCFRYWRAGDKYRLAPYSTIRAPIVWLCQTSIENGLELFANSRLYDWIIS